MKMRLKRAGLGVIGVIAIWSSGCRADVRAVPPPPPSTAPAPAAATAPTAPPAANAAVARTGYAVQVGAFSVVDNARRLAQALNDIGLDAYYFPQGTGLDRVRFGDFPSRDAAVREAERLLGQKLIPGYFIVGPPIQPVYGRNPASSDLREKLAATAESFIGVEYAWGGTSKPGGVDCSGLVRAVYQLNGLNLPRAMGDQYRAGTPIPRDRLKKGDLVFFSGSPGQSVSHVGMYVGENTFIHAPGTGKHVRADSLDSGYFKARFSGARAYLN